jgi:hypothetical protein
MTKLLKAYLNNPTLENAQKIKAYSRKHPFASTTLTQYDTELLNDALRHAIGLSSYPSERRI